MKYTLYQESRKGGRNTNQDRVGHAYTQECILMVLADGMGGHAHGEVAAQLLLDTILGIFARLARPRLEAITEFLLDSLYLAHEAINTFAGKQGMPDPPRTTAVVCVVQSGHAYWAHVGDSRLYHFGRGRLLSRTRDHSAVQQLIDEGLLTEENSGHHPDRNKLYNCVGGYILPNIELSPGVSLREGDALLLSSDGFWSEFNPDEILGTLSVYPIKQALVHLLDHAEYRAGERGDNLSVMALRCGEETFAADQDDLGDLGLGGFTTELREIGNHPPAGPAMSDGEIDKAVAEIQAALEKHNLQDWKP